MTPRAPASCIPLLVFSLVLVLAPNALAQICGDADGSGAVSVTDGVQTLRAATSLSSTCTAARCDVDGDGSISVTDGVNVLRKAAGLSAPNACPGSQGDGVQVALDSVVPFLAFGFSFASDVSLASGAVPAGDVDDPCPDGGTRSKRFLSQGILRIGFNACRYSNPALGSFQFDKGLVINFIRSQVSLSVDVTDVTDPGNPRLVHFDNFFDFVPRNGGGFIARLGSGDTGGPIVLTTPQGNFLLTLNELNIDGDGHAVSGGGAIEEETSPGNFDLRRIDFQVIGPGTADLTATFDDGRTTRFVVNLVTGEVTPA